MRHQLAVAIHTDDIHKELPSTSYVNEWRYRKRRQAGIILENCFKNNEFTVGKKG